MFVGATTGDTVGDDVDGAGVDPKDGAKDGFLLGDFDGASVDGVLVVATEEGYIVGMLCVGD